MSLPEHHTEQDPSQPGLVQAVPRQLRTQWATWLPLNIVSCIGGIHLWHKITIHWKVKSDKESSPLLHWQQYRGSRNGTGGRCNGESVTQT